MSLIMIHILLFGILLKFVSSSYRGPHHPKSSISHHHYVPQHQVKLTQDEEFLHDTIHLKEDLGPIANQLAISNMSKQELDFYFFKLHDIDSNTKLDGLEILHAIQHTLHNQEESQENKITDYPIIQKNIFWIIELIDKVLEEDDLNNDGFLGYMEFINSRTKNVYYDVKKNIW